MDEEYLEEYDEQTDIDALETEMATMKLRLYQEMDNMTSRDRSVFIKLIQMNTINEALDAACNLKKTSESTWKRVLGKLNAIKGIKNATDKSGFDFDKLLEILLPALGMLAGTLLALRQFEKASSDAAKPKENKKDEELHLKAKAAIEAKKIKSVILQYCSNNENGYSIDGSTGSK